MRLHRDDLQKRYEEIIGKVCEASFFQLGPLLALAPWRT